MDKQIDLYGAIKHLSLEQVLYMAREGTAPKKLVPSSSPVAETSKKTSLLPRKPV